jgi:hypothetical protein
MISGKELAERLGVSSATLSQATSKAHLCRGHNVSAWAVRSPNGRVIGYEVPAYVAATLRPSLVRVNPSPSGDGQSKEASPLPVVVVPSVLAPSGDSSSKAPSPPPVVEVPSLLPPSQDYFKPVAVASAAHVVTKALERDTPSGCMVTTTVAVAVGALTGNHIAGKGGALVGAGLSLLLAVLMYWPQAEASSCPPVLGRWAPEAAVPAQPWLPLRGLASTPRSRVVIMRPGNERCKILR